MPLTKETPYPHDSMFHFLCLEHIFTFLPSRHYPQSFSVKSHFYNYLLIFRFKKFTLIYFPYKNSRLRIGLSIVPRLHLTEFLISCFSHLDLLSRWEITMKTVHDGHLGCFHDVSQKEKHQYSTLTGI